MTEGWLSSSCLAPCHMAPLFHENFQKLYNTMYIKRWYIQHKLHGPELAISSVQTDPSLPVRSGVLCKIKAYIFKKTGLEFRVIFGALFREALSVGQIKGLEATMRTTALPLLAVWPWKRSSLSQFPSVKNWDTTPTFLLHRDVVRMNLHLQCSEDDLLTIPMLWSLTLRLQQYYGQYSRNVRNSIINISFWTCEIFCSHKSDFVGFKKLNHFFNIIFFSVV